MVWTPKVSFFGLQAFFRRYIAVIGYLYRVWKALRYIRVLVRACLKHNVIRRRKTI
jgi:hypothetical protein